MISSQKNPNFEPRWTHIYRLWENFLQLNSLPQFDRWVAEEFKKNSKFGSTDRKWYSEMLFAGIRFGHFVVFCSLASNTLKKAKTNLTNPSIVQNSLDALWPDVLCQFNRCTRTQSELISQWKALTSEEFYYWVRLRCVSEKKEILNLRPRTDFFPGSGFVYEAIEKLIQKVPSLENQLLFASVPLQFLNPLKMRCEKSLWTDANISTFIKNQNIRPPLWLRMNSADKTPTVTAELIQENFTVQSFENALLASGTKGIFTTESYRAGLFEIQDLASQKIGNSVECAPGQLVWDCCAGGGGKTLQIASRLQNRGAVYASDIREYKLEEVKKRARRAGFFNIRCMVWDGTTLPNFPKEIQNKKGFDWVLVDAPCSSSGTWRRNPDAKYKIEQNNIDTLTALQFQLLTHSSQAVKPRGHLVYSTCSWLVEENENVVERFLAANEKFSLKSSTLYGSPFSDADTMYAAVLVKNDGG